MIDTIQVICNNEWQGDPVTNQHMSCISQIYNIDNIDMFSFFLKDLLHNSMNDKIVTNMRVNQLQSQNYFFCNACVRFVNIKQAIILIHDNNFSWSILCIFIFHNHRTFLQFLRHEYVYPTSLVCCEKFTNFL